MRLNLLRRVFIYMHRNSMFGPWVPSPQWALRPLMWNAHQTGSSPPRRIVPRGGAGGRRVSGTIAGIPFPFLSCSAAFRDHPGSHCLLSRTSRPQPFPVAVPPQAHCSLPVSRWGAEKRQSCAAGRLELAFLITCFWHLMIMRTECFHMSASDLIMTNINTGNCLF